VTLFGAGLFKTATTTWPWWKWTLPTWIRKSRDGGLFQTPSCRFGGDLCFRLSGSTVRGGDSGGAFVGWTGSGWKLLDVVSGVQSDDGRTIAFDYAASLADPAIRSWIDQQLTSSGGPGQTPQPQPQPSPTYSETTGGETHTWTNYTNAGGNQGPVISTHTTVQIACKLQGFRVADGNTWWYRIAQSPWNSQYYASADAFYNNGQTSGSLRGTPFVDPNVRNC
jgi:hypothetical protein